MLRRIGGGSPRKRFAAFIRQQSQVARVRRPTLPAISRDRPPRVRADYMGRQAGHGHTESKAQSCGSCTTRGRHRANVPPWTRPCFGVNLSTLGTLACVCFVGYCRPARLAALVVSGPHPPLVLTSSASARVRLTGPHKAGVAMVPGKADLHAWPLGVSSLLSRHSKSLYNCCCYLLAPDPSRYSIFRNKALLLTWTFPQTVTTTSH